LHVCQGALGVVWSYDGVAHARPSDIRAYSAGPVAQLGPVNWKPS
jgi:hypothetical protein